MSDVEAQTARGPVAYYAVTKSAPILRPGALRVAYQPVRPYPTVLHCTGIASGPGPSPPPSGGGGSGSSVFGSGHMEFSTTSVVETVDYVYWVPHTNATGQPP
jgi:hypothetical protein